MVNGGSGDVGGLAGYTTGTAAKTFTNCSVDCTVTAPKSTNGGIFFGYIAEAAITLTSCKAYGTVVLAGETNIVTSENIATLCFAECKTDTNTTIDTSSVVVVSTKQ